MNLLQTLQNKMTTKKIKIKNKKGTKTKTLLLDEFYWDLFKDEKLYTNKKNYVFYRDKKNQRNILISREIMNFPTKTIAGERLVAHHINHNPLDNRLSNLEVRTHAENLQHQISKCGLSKYKGVSLRHDSKKWLAKITVNYKQIALGSFSKERDAAIAYNNAAEKYFKNPLLNKI